MEGLRIYPKHHDVEVQIGSGTGHVPHHVGSSDREWNRARSFRLDSYRHVSPL